MDPTFTRILVPTDFGVESKTAFRVAVSLARALGASISLLHVARHPASTMATPDLYGVDLAEIEENIVHDADVRLTALAETAADLRITCDVRFGKSADTIVRAAADAEVDLIVMGTHGRGPVGHLLLGSVAERVVRAAACPVMTVRDSGAVRIAPGETEGAARQVAEYGV